MKRQKTPDQEENGMNTSENTNEHKEYPHSHRGGLGTAFILIIIGTIFLLNNFGVLPWNVWRDLWRFWPLFLIFWGFQLIFGKSKIANILLLLTATLILAYFVLNTVASTNPQFNDYFKQNFPIWQNIYHYNPPTEDSNDDDNQMGRRRMLRRPAQPPTPPEIDFGDPDNQFDLP